MTRRDWAAFRLAIAALMFAIGSGLMLAMGCVQPPLRDDVYALQTAVDDLLVEVEATSATMEEKVDATAQLAYSSGFSAGLECSQRVHNGEVIMADPTNTTIGELMRLCGAEWNRRED